MITFYCLSFFLAFIILAILDLKTGSIDTKLNYRGSNRVNSNFIKNVNNNKDNRVASSISAKSNYRNNIGVKLDVIANGKDIEVV